MITPLPLKRGSTSSLLIFFCFTSYFGYCQTSSDNAQLINSLVYKFTVENITDQVSAESVKQTLLSNSIFASVKFFDEADCFKLTATEILTYDSLKEALLVDGYHLSNEVFLSDETILRANPNIPELK